MNEHDEEEESVGLMVATFIFNHHLSVSRTKWFSFIFSILIHPKNASFAYKLFLTKCVSTSRKSYLISPQSSAYHHSFTLFLLSLSLSLSCKTISVNFQIFILHYMYFSSCVLLACWKTQHHKTKERTGGGKKTVKSEREWGKMVFKKQNIGEREKKKSLFSNIMLEIEMNRKFSLLYPHASIYIYMYVCRLEKY